MRCVLALIACYELSGSLQNITERGMGEILVALFIGIWLALAGMFAYRRLKKDYEGMENTKE